MIILWGCICACRCIQICAFMHLPSPQLPPRCSTGNDFSSSPSTPFPFNAKQRSKIRGLSLSIYPIRDHWSSLAPSSLLWSRSKGQCHYRRSPRLRIRVRSNGVRLAFRGLRQPMLEYHWQLLTHHTHSWGQPTTLYFNTVITSRTRVVVVIAVLPLLLSSDATIHPTLCIACCCDASTPSLHRATPLPPCTKANQRQKRKQEQRCAAARQFSFHRYSLLVSRQSQGIILARYCYHILRCV